MRRLAVLAAALGLLTAAGMVGHVGLRAAASNGGSLSSTAAGTCAWCHGR